MTLNLDPPNRAHFLRGKGIGRGLLLSKIGQLLRMVEARNEVLREQRGDAEIIISLRRRVRALEAELLELRKEQHASAQNPHA